MYLGWPISDWFRGGRMVPRGLVKKRSERGSGFCRERMSGRKKMQLNRWAIGWTVWRRLDLSDYRRHWEPARARRGNVVTGNGTALRRCSPDGRTNVRVLLFQLCGLPVFPLRLFHRLSSLPRLRLAFFLTVPRHVRLNVTVHVYRSGFLLFFRRLIWNSRPSERVIVNK